MRRRSILILSSALCLVTAGGPLSAAEQVYPAAVLPFQERGADVKGFGPKVTDLMFANLVVDPRIYLVDREDLEKVLKELELNLSGLVRPEEAARVGQLTGAKLLVTGSVLQVDSSLYLVAKIIGTETTRVLGASVKGRVNDELDGLVEELAGEVCKTMAARCDELVAKPKTREDRLAALKKSLGKGKRPVVKINIKERHVGQIPIDPAAETEIALLASESGFEVIDPDEAGGRKAEVLLIGEGVSEFATRHGNLISVKARLELKAVDAASGRVLAIDRQTTVQVDLTEQLAGKAALQEAAAEIAGRMLPKILQPLPEKKPRKRKER
jgi:TolB-like protein